MAEKKCMISFIDDYIDSTYTFACVLIIILYIY